MRSHLIPLCLLVATPAYSATLHCRSDYDDSSHYEITASLGKRGTVGLRYVTEDGVDLHSDLSAKKQEVSLGHSIRLEAENATMGLRLDTVFDSGSLSYKGTAQLRFSLEHAEPVDLAADCFVRD
jgi:hypothetical protein